MKVNTVDGRTVTVSDDELVLKAGELLMQREEYHRAWMFEQGHVLGLRFINGLAAATGAYEPMQIEGGHVAADAWVECVVGPLLRSMMKGMHRAQQDMIDQRGEQIIMRRQQMKARPRSSAKVPGGDLLWKAISAAVAGAVAGTAINKARDAAEVGEGAHDEGV